MLGLGMSPSRWITRCGFVDYLTRVFVPIRDFSGKFAGIQRALAALERIFDLLDTRAEIPSGTQVLTDESPEIELNNVSFKYRPDDTYALKDISFKIEGEVIALVGETGSGKTTIGKLIMRQYDGYDGRITVGGHSIDKLDASSLKQMISMDFIKTILSTGPSKVTLPYGRTALSMQIYNGLSRAHASDTLLTKTTEGLQHKVTERGRNLSAGERQLIEYCEGTCTYIAYRYSR